MKKNYLLLLTFCIATIPFVGCKKETTTNANIPDNLVDGLFSVSSTQQVYFASGNLTTNGRDFCTNQWDYGGLFGWGTGDDPYNTSWDYHDYLPFDDWGNYIEGGWRTLSIEEWAYLIEGRNNANKKLSFGTVNGIHGMILLPDEWSIPSGCTFNVSLWANWNANVYNKSQWGKMEKNGAVFLPAAGHWEDFLVDVGEVFYYWSSTQYNEEKAYGIFLYDSQLSAYYFYLAERCSVRLVHDN